MRIQLFQNGCRHLLSFTPALVQHCRRLSSPRRRRFPVKGMVTMVDLGAKKCIPCKMMAPILEKLEKEYAGRAAVIFLDVWEDPEPAKRFGIRAIPTQIFFDKEGKEVFRHVGFLSEEEIVRRLKDMGVK